MKASKNCIQLLHHYERCKLQAYPDPKTGGDPWTIGWGHTGQEVKRGLVWTQEKSDAVFLDDLAKFEAGVNSLVKTEITQWQFDALVSFAYNCGLDIDADTKAEGLGDSTLLCLVNERRFLSAADEFLKWISRGTPVERGLRRRRAAERALFMGASFDDAIKIGSVAA